MDVARSGEHVLMLDEGWSSTVYLARAFELAGYRVTVAAFTADVDRIAHDHLLPLTERAMAAVWARGRANVFPATAPWQRRLVADKHALLAHVAARGVAVPRSVPLDASFDARAAIAELGLPLVVKGATGACGERVWMADSRVELDRAIARARSTDDRWIVQEHVAGSTYLVGGVFDRGRPLRVYAAEKLEQYPPRTGPAIRLRSLADPVLVATGLRAIRELAWTGFASADLVRTRDGYALLEINPRLWGSIAGARAANVDMFTPFIELVAGRAPAADLRFTDRSECAIFPRNLAAHPGQALRACASAQGRDWLGLRTLLGRALRYGLITRRPTANR